MRLGGDVDDARGGGFPEPAQQEVGEHEIAHMVERESTLPAILGQGMAIEERPGIVDQHVDPPGLRQEIGGEPALLGQAREIG